VKLLGCAREMTAAGDGLHIPELTKLHLDLS
jgi:hypothetical protein